MPRQEEIPPFSEEDLSDPTGAGQDHVLRNYEADEIRRWIKVMCRMAGMSPTQLARAASVAPSTLNRFLNNPSVKHKPSTTTLGKIEGAASLAYSDRVKITWGRKQYPPFGPSEDRHLGDIKKPFDLNLLPVVDVIGAVEAGTWVEGIEWPVEDRFTVPIIEFPGFEGSPKYALEVYGDSMNEVYPPGSIIICVHPIHVDRNPLPGERVVVRQTSENGLSEFTVKEFQIDNKGQPWLWPRSTNPEHQTPIKIDPTGEDDNVVITGIVIGSIRPEPSTQA